MRKSLKIVLQSACLTLIWPLIVSAESYKPLNSSRLAPTPLPVGSSYYSTTGLGFSSADNLVGVSPALSLLQIQADEMSSIHAVFGLADISPFLFGMAGTYQYTILGNLNSGLHWGPGLSFGTQPKAGGGSSFFLQVNGLIGIHFLIPSMNRIYFSFDGGPMLRLRSGGQDFRISGIGSIMGFSVHCLF